MKFIRIVESERARIDGLTMMMMFMMLKRVVMMMRMMLTHNHACHIAHIHVDHTQQVTQSTCRLCNIHRTHIMYRLVYTTCLVKDYIILLRFVF